MCGSKDETVQHNLCGCPIKLAQVEHKKRHYAVGHMVNWEICRKFGLDCSNKKGIESLKSWVETGTSITGN